MTPSNTTHGQRFRDAQDSGQFPFQLLHAFPDRQGAPQMSRGQSRKNVVSHVCKLVLMGVEVNYEGEPCRVRNVLAERLPERSKF
jgi:hypothetical protein